MTSLGDADLSGIIDFRHGVAVTDGNFCQGADHIQCRHRGGRRLDAVDLRRNLETDLIKILILQIRDPVSRREQRVFQILQFLCKVAFIGDQCLFPDIAFRQLGEIGGVRNIDIITEHLVVSHFQFLASGFLPLTFLQFRHHSGAVVPDLAQPVDLLGISLPQDPAFPDGEGRIFIDRFFNNLPDIVQKIHFSDLLQKRGPGILQLMGQRRNLGGTVCQCHQVFSVGRTVNDPSDEPLHVGDLMQDCRQFTALDHGLGKLFHRRQPSFDGNR